MNGQTSDLFGNDEVQIRLPVIVPLAQLKPNPWNPNKVARPELELLKRSIQKSGFCFPIVVIQEAETSYMIVDGFHRHLVAQQLKMTHVPVVILDDPPAELMAATIRFNRARGTHQIDQMSNIVADLTQMGVPGLDVARDLGMDADELLRLQQNAGIAELFRDHRWSTAWEPTR